MKTNSWLALLVAFCALTVPAVWGANFVGPMVLECPAVAGENLCIADVSGLLNCPNIMECNTFDPSGIPLSTGTYTVILPCSCVVANNCPGNCTIVKGSSDSTASNPTTAAAPSPSMSSLSSGNSPSASSSSSTHIMRAVVAVAAAGATVGWMLL